MAPTISLLFKALNKSPKASKSEPCPKNKAAPTINSNELTTNAPVNWMFESHVVKRIASLMLLLDERSILRVCEIDECKYKLCGITVAPTIPSANINCPCFKMSLCGTKFTATSPMSGLAKTAMYRKTSKITAINVTTIASILRNPNFINSNNSKTSRAVIITPHSNGNPNSK